MTKGEREGKSSAERSKEESSQLHNRSHVTRRNRDYNKVPVTDPNKNLIA